MPDKVALPPFDVVIVAAGEGRRTGQPLPKQFVLYRGKPLLLHSAQAFQRMGASRIVVVHPPGHEQQVRDIVGAEPVFAFATGGATRQTSVRNGLAKLGTGGADKVLIHDAARPGISRAVVTRLLAALDGAEGAIPALLVSDSLVRGAAGEMRGAVDRADVWRVQTPQAFQRAAIVTAHANWRGAPDAGDDAQVLAALGKRVVIVAGDEGLKKVTYADDFSLPDLPMRVGSGYDVHRLQDGEELWLGGLRIEHHQGLSGHSDADVVLHALVDALLGAIAQGDIGSHFPPSDPQWAGAASDRFVRYAVELVREHGYAPGNIDLTIICEAPRIGPHRAAMQVRIAELLRVDPAVVSIKATTTERLGFTGRGEGIAAQAVAMLVKGF